MSWKDLRQIRQEQRAAMSRYQAARNAVQGLRPGTNAYQRAISRREKASAQESGLAATGDSLETRLRNNM